MTLRAMYSGQFILAPDISSGRNGLSIAETRILSKGRQLSCGDCGSLMRYKHGEIITPHFAHDVENRDCRSYGISAEHLAVQSYLYDLLMKHKQFAKGDIEHTTKSGRRFDLYFETAPLTQISSSSCVFRVGIEVQKSPALISEWRRRLELGTADRVHTMTVLIPGHYGIDIGAYPEPRKNPKELERLLHKLNCGAIYYSWGNEICSRRAEPSEPGDFSFLDEGKKDIGHSYLNIIPSERSFPGEERKFKIATFSDAGLSEEEVDALEDRI